MTSNQFNRLCLIISTHVSHYRISNVNSSGWYDVIIAIYFKHLPVLCIFPSSGFIVWSENEINIFVWNYDGQLPGYRTVRYQDKEICTCIAMRSLNMSLWINLIQLLIKNKRHKLNFRYNNRKWIKLIAPKELTVQDDTSYFRAVNSQWQKSDTLLQ